MKKELLKHPAFVKFKSLKTEVDFIKSQSDKLRKGYIWTDDIQKVLVNWVCSKLTSIYLSVSPKLGTLEKTWQDLNYSNQKESPYFKLVSFFMTYIPRNLGHWDLASLYESLGLLMEILFEYDAEHMLVTKLSDVLKKVFEFATSILNDLLDKKFDEKCGLILANVLTVDAKI
ncbi:hypothetical protein SGZLLDDJ_CDS_0036 [Mycoplasmopsis phage vB_Mfe_PMF329]|nr:hypothetical protein SGZLLDDJ_CDS_0036 [Mycoplasmopsis phage vB_Mfe_PMF329]